MTKSYPTTKEIFRHLEKGFRKKDHPFRFFTLATHDHAYPALRTVVLRRTRQDQWIAFYTDSRSEKAAQLHQKEQATALFYHPKKRWQLQLKGRCVKLEDQEILDSLWKNMPEGARRDYSSAMPPGSVAHSEETLEWNDEGRKHFTVYHLEVDEIESLQLRREGHLRLRYTRKNKGWKQELLVP